MIIKENVLVLRRCMLKYFEVKYHAVYSLLSNGLEKLLIKMHIYAHREHMFDNVSNWW